MADESGGSNETKPPTTGNLPSSHRSSFLSTLFRRSLSISVDPLQDDKLDRPVTRKSRTRGYSESSLEDFDNNVTHNRDRALTSVNARVPSSQNTHRQRSMSLSAMLLGARSLGNDIDDIIGDDNVYKNVDFDPSEKEKENVDSDAVFLNDQKLSQNHELTQTDRLNKKLLDSFLNRINGIATTIMDPSGTGETTGQVYTDDVIMDRILRRVESNKD